MTTESESSQGPDRRHGARRQQPIGTLPFNDRRANNRRTGAERRSTERN